MRFHIGLAILAAGLIALLPGAGRAVDGFNLPGSDYANFPTNSQVLCRNTCGGDARCQAWTWVKPGVQGPAGRCWLKSPEPALVRDSCCASGSHKNIQPSALKAEARTNRPGRDYRNLAMDSWAACEATCADEARCTAWSYVRPGIQGPRGQCWLKSAVPFPIDDANVVSGVKYKSAAGRFD